MLMPTAAAEKPEGALKVLMCTIAWREKLLDYALEAARETGFDGVEIWGREPHVPERFDESRMRATKRLIDATGVTPHVFGSYLKFGATRNDSDIQPNDVLHIARWLRTPLIRVWASDVSSRGASPEVWKAAVSEAQEACDRASNLDMALVVEMHDGTLADTGPSARRLVEQVARDNFKLNFQVASHDDGQTPEERLETVLPWVAHVHAQNYDKMPGQEGEAVGKAPLALGVVSYPRLVGTLKDAGYDGCIAVEFAYDETGDKEAALAEDLRFLRSIC